ncbi:MAG: ABC transporter ATP-binding protein [Verrucomicrobiota bacterium]
MYESYTYLRKLLNFGWPYLKPYRKRFFIGIGFGILFAASNGLVVGSTKFIVERFEPQSKLVDSVEIKSWQQSVLQKGAQQLDPWVPLKGRPLDWRQITGGVLLIAILSALRGSMGFLSSYCMSWANEQMIQDLRAAIVKKLNSLSLGYFQKTHTGDLITHIQSDTSSLQRAFVHGLPDTIREPFTLIFVCGALFLMDWQLTLLTMFFFPLCIIPVMVLGKRLRKIAERQRAASVNQSGQFLQVMANMRVVQAFNLEDQQSNEFHDISRLIARQNIKATVAQRLINPIIETMAGLAFGVLLVYIVWANYQTSDMAAFLVAAALSFGPIKKVSNLTLMFQKTTVGVERLQTLFATRSDVENRSTGCRLTSFEDCLCFEDVSFQYEKHPVLQNISFTIKKGERIGIVGESGSGKSTLVNLLFRFYDPVSGRIIIDGTDYKELSLDSLRSQLALVSQDILLFNQSVLDNIALGKRSATNEEVIVAARTANAHSFIERMPENYSSQVGEWGSRVSGGQKQRLSLARAFVRQAPILVLDEATAALDSESEKEILTAIDNLPLDRTIISVAHRLSTLRTMNRILVLENGELAQEGTYSELLSSPGAFSRLASHQGLL